MYECAGPSKSKYLKFFIGALAVIGQAFSTVHPFFFARASEHVKN